MSNHCECECECHNDNDQDNNDQDNNDQDNNDQDNNNNHRCIKNYKQTFCYSCFNPAATAIITQKIINKQVRVASSMHMMNLSAFTSAANRLASKTNTNWNQMSDRVLPAQQTTIIPTQGNSLHRTLTSNKPGGSSPGGLGVDIKHDSYARYLNRKKATQIIKAPQTTLTSNTINCCK